MRIAQIDPCEVVNGNNVGASLYIQGCPIHCKGCFNPETGDFYGGEEGTLAKEAAVYATLEPYEIHRFSILGGEPLYIENIMELYCLVCGVTSFFPDKEIGLWTGYTGEELQARIDKADSEWPHIIKDTYLYPLLKQIDYIITGPFVEEQKDLTLQWRGSKNQEVLMCKESLRQGKKIYYTE